MTVPDIRNQLHPEPLCGFCSYGLFIPKACTSQWDIQGNQSVVINNIDDEVP